MKIKHHNVFLIWLILNLFVLAWILTWETDYHHLENNTFAMVGMVALNLPVSIVVYYPIKKSGFLRNKPSPGLNPWSRPEESGMIFIKLKWIMTLIIFMTAGFFQWRIYSLLFNKIIGKK